MLLLLTKLAQMEINEMNGKAENELLDELDKDGESQLYRDVLKELIDE